MLFDCPLTVLVLLTIGRCGSDSLVGPLFWFPMLPKIKGESEDKIEVVVMMIIMMMTDDDVVEKVETSHTLFCG